MSQSPTSFTLAAGRVTRITWALTALFLLALLPILTSTARYHDDEQYYTDAAIRMVETGDYLTPYHADATLRFQKPILTYWAVIAGYKVLGIGYFASRILFLIAGAILLRLVLGVSRALFRDEAAALLAVVILFSNNEMFTASLRATPDMLLGLFATASFFGFARILFRNENRRRWRLLAYGGAGLAFATKGMLAIPIVVWPLLLGWFRRRRGHDTGRLADPVSVLLGVLLAGGWFGAVVAIHGTAAVTGFYTDQVGMRTGTAGLRILTHALTYLATLLRDFLPWTLLLVAALPLAGPGLRGFLREHRWAVAFVAGAYLILLVIFSSANIFRPRYFFPVFPMLAALLGGLLAASFRDARFASSLWRLDRVLLGLALGAGTLVAILGLRVDYRFFISGVVILAAAVALYAAARRMGPALRVLAAGLFLFTLLWTYDMFARPVFAVSPAPALVSSLRGVPEDAGIEGVGIAPKYLSQMRVLSRGRLLPVPRSALPPEGNAGSDLPVLIVSEARADSIDRNLYHVEPGGISYRNPEAADLLRAVIDGPSSGLFDRLRRYYYVAIPRHGNP